MTRSTRLDQPGATHHVMGRTISGRPLFGDDYDRISFIVRLGRCCVCCGVKVLAWCLMPNHFHLLVRTSDTPLSSFMARLLTGHAAHMNTRHKGSGHLFQGRFKSIFVADESYLSELIRYIHLNPIRAGLLKKPGDLEDYRWCGHRMLTGSPAPVWMDVRSALGAFAEDTRSAVRSYQQFMAEGVLPGGAEHVPVHALTRSGIDGPGGRAVSREHECSREHLAGDIPTVRNVARKIPEQVRSRFRKRGPADAGIAALFEEVKKRWQVNRNDISKRSWGGDISKARAFMAYYLTTELGFSLAEAGRRLGISRVATYRAVMRFVHRGGGAGGSGEAEVNEVNSDPYRRKSEKKTR
ncbi:transposase [Candidatus Fermentibacteria bacterium]|nr:transposase [Candidatus Fermentibacteria bacterium]